MVTGTRYFIDVDGHIWSVNQNGESNFKQDFKIDGNNLMVLGADDDLSDGREVVDEYVLWPTLTSLALVIEKDIPEHHHLPPYDVNDSAQVKELKQKCQKLINDRNQAWFILEEMEDKISSLIGKVDKSSVAKSERETNLV